MSDKYVAMDVHKASVAEAAVLIRSLRAPLRFSLNRDSLVPAPLIFTISELNALLGADARVEWVLYFLHLGDQVSGLNQRCRGVPASYDYV